MIISLVFFVNLRRAISIATSPIFSSKNLRVLGFPNSLRRTGPISSTDFLKISPIAGAIKDKNPDENKLSPWDFVSLSSGLLRGTIPINLLIFTAILPRINQTYFIVSNHVIVPCVLIEDPLKAEF